MFFNPAAEDGAARSLASPFHTLIRKDGFEEVILRSVSNGPGVSLSALLSSAGPWWPSPRGAEWAFDWINKAADWTWWCVCFTGRSRRSILPQPPPTPHPHPPQPPQQKEQKSHLLPAEHPKRSPGWRGCWGVGVVVYCSNGKPVMVQWKSRLLFLFTFPHIWCQAEFFFLLFFFRNLWGLSGVYLHLEETGGNRLRHMFCQARSSRPIRVAKCWIRLIMIQC